MYDEIFCMQAPNFHDNHLSERFFPHEEVISYQKIIFDKFFVSLK